MELWHAHTILPIDTPPIPDGAVVIDGSKIKAVGSFRQLRERFEYKAKTDFTDCLILPGFVNAHTHLELSHLKDKVPFEGDFVDWVRKLVYLRTADTANPGEIIARACHESLRSGVTTVADISYENRSWAHLHKIPIRKVCFAEVFGMTQDTNTPKKYLENCIKNTRQDGLLKLGLSPHSPYSASGQIYQLAADLATRHNLPLTTHLAETNEEIEFLTRGTGPWRRYLEEIGRWDGSFPVPGRRPIDYFLSMPLGEQPFILAHVNYLIGKEISALARSSHSVAYCPRSHRFFRHSNHPFRQMIQAGINVCLGTDSLASNDSLSILDELRYLHSCQPDFPAATLLQMATCNGARALGLGHICGTITAGKEADLTVIPLTKSKPHDALTDILESESQPILTLVAGQRVFHR